MVSNTWKTERYVFKLDTRVKNNIKLVNPFFFFSLENTNEEDDNLPSMETLEISKNSRIQSIPAYFGGAEEEEIPDMDELEGADNLVENDPVSYRFISISEIAVFWR